MSNNTREIAEIAVTFMLAAVIIGLLIFMGRWFVKYQYQTVPLLYNECMEQAKSKPDELACYNYYYGGH